MSRDAGKIQELLKEQVGLEVAGVDAGLRIRVYFLFIHGFTARVAEGLPRKIFAWYAIREEHLGGGGSPLPDGHLGQSQDGLTSGADTGAFSTGCQKNERRIS